MALNASALVARFALSVPAPLPCGITGGSSSSSSSSSRRASVLAKQQRVSNVSRTVRPAAVTDLRPDGLRRPVFSCHRARGSRFASRSTAASSLWRTVTCSGVAGWQAGAGGGAGSGARPDALLFDCDGVLVDTERDGHRVSFNHAFREKGLNGVEWGVDLYGELLAIGGGKERMTHYFNKVGWPAAAPEDEEGRKVFVADLHKRKTKLFMDLVETGALPLRPGVARLIDEALASGVRVAVCSTSNEKAVSAIVRVMLGPERAAQMQIFAGDVVPRKKPDPAIYLLAASTLGIDPSRCVVVEDSHIGVRAAKSAGMTCVVTVSGYTAGEDFTGADAIFDCIGDPPTQNFDLDFLTNLMLLRQLESQRSSANA